MLTLLLACNETHLQEVEKGVEDGLRQLVADPGEVDFGVLAGTLPVAQTVRVTSIGDLPVTVESIDVTGSSAYSITWALSPTSLDPGDGLDVLVTYTPQSIDDLAALSVHNDGVEGILTVPLLGAGTYPGIQVDPVSLAFQSDEGENVTRTATITSVGTADLTIGTHVVDGGPFEAVMDTPITLAPGETTTVDVTYTPGPEGENVSGTLWLGTNTPIGYATVPLTGHRGAVCVGLGEAWDTGLLDAHTDSSGMNLVLANNSADTDICIDRWYVFRSETSQDLGAGDMEYDVGGDFPAGSLTLSAGGTLVFGGGDRTDASWWCLEDTQYTQGGQDYTFTGARVFDPVVGFMTGQDQDAVWGWQDDHPLMMAARDVNYVEVPAAGGTAEVTVRSFDMGSEDGEAELAETVPPGWSASDFSIEPDRVDDNDDGSTTYTWSVSLQARIKTEMYTDTTYDEETVTYTLHTLPCAGRQYLPPLTSTWRDADDVERVDTANPLVVNCVE